MILDVNGVGYIVHCSGRTLQKLPRPGEASTLAIETQMREDSIKLFGFISETEREWFRLLQSVQGVGAKVALAIQTVLDVAELASAIACQDKAAIARAPGGWAEARGANRLGIKGQGSCFRRGRRGGRASWRPRWRPAGRRARRPLGFGQSRLRAAPGRGGGGGFGGGTWRRRACFRTDLSRP